MIKLQALEIFCFSTATVIDLALLFALLEKHNWQRVMLPVLLLVLGSSLFHGSAAVHTAFAAATMDWAEAIHWGTLLGIACGLLLMPSALLHCMILLYSGTAASQPGVWRYALLYLPMLSLVSVVDTLNNSQEQRFMDVFAPVLMPFMVWAGLANLISAVGFYLARKHYQQALTRQFLLQLMVLLVAITLVNGWVIVYANAEWSDVAPYWTLFSAMTPLLLAFLLAYYMMRYQLMQLVVERSVVYSAVLVMMVLFHHIFLNDLFKQLSNHAKMDLAWLEGAFIITLIIAIQPFRQRVAEALRYLLGSRISHMRDQTRRLSIQMRHLSEQSPESMADWFVEQITQGLNLEYAVVWLFNRERVQVTFSTNPELLEASKIMAIDQSLRSHDQLVCQAYDAPDPVITRLMYEVNACLALSLDNESVAGLVLLGPLPRGVPLNEEQRTALVLLVEQFSIALHNSELQASRIAAERQAIHHEKLSTLGLVASSIAHEIKNPLSSIKTIVSVMREDQQANSEYSEDLQVITQEIDRLSDTVSRLLKFVRPTQVDTGGCDVAGVIEDTLRIMKHVAERQNIQIVFQNQSERGWVLASENAVRDIVFNLIVNALDAVESNGRIDLFCSCEQSYIRIEIRDSGPGISAEVQARLFQPFITNKTQGTGLGLYMVGRHIHELKGKIDYHYQEGAVFTVDLPVMSE